MSQYGYNDNGTPLRADGTPINFGGSKEDYDRYKATEKERKEYNLATAAERHAAKSAGEYYPGYDDYQSGSRYNGGSSGGSGMSDYQRRLQEAINNNVKAMESQKGVINQQYGDIAAQQYVLHRQGQKNMPSQLSGRGDGDIASLQLQANANYQNAVSDTLLARDNALLGVDNDILQYKASGEMQMAEYAEKYAQQELARQQALEDEARSQNWQKEFFDYQNNASSQSYKDKLALQNYYDNLKKSASDEAVSNTGGANGGSAVSSGDQSIYNSLRSMGVSATDAERMVANGTWKAYLNGAM